MEPNAASLGHDSPLHREAREWLLLLTSGRATVADAQGFHRWCAQSVAHARAFAETRLMWEHLGSAARNLAQRERAPDRTADAPRRMSRRAFLGGAVAASAAALLLARPPLRLWPDLSDLSADFRTATGEQRTVQVAPGVTVEMNTQTAFNLRKVDDHLVGMDLLDGEVQLQVAEGVGDFTVWAEKGRVQPAPGSQCNVRCLGGDVEVTGLDGTVRLDYRGRREALGVAQQASYGAHDMTAPAPADLERAMAWRRRVLVFENQPLSEVVAEINRYRPGRLVLTNETLASRKVRARFSLNQLADAATLIHEAFGARVRELPGGIVLLS
jgi:ferric-dicitrate binding protein FerR (iron transport regulator)